MSDSVWPVSNSVRRVGDCVRRAALATLAMLVVVAVSTAGLLGVALAASDPFIGTWVMDPQRSRYEAGDLPQSMSIVMTSAGQGIYYRSQTTLSNGSHVSSAYTADYDGSVAMVLGTTGIMAPVSLRRVDDRTVECSYMKGLRVVASSRRVISENGATMTITTVSPGKDGATSTNVAFFARAQ